MLSALGGIKRLSVLMFFVLGVIKQQVFDLKLFRKSACVLNGGMVLSHRAKKYRPRRKAKASVKQPLLFLHFFLAGL